MVFWFLVGWLQLAAETIPGIVTALVLFAVLVTPFCCAACLADVPAQYLSCRQAWRRWGWLLWLTGTRVAAVFATLGSCILFFEPPLV